MQIKCFHFNFIQVNTLVVFDETKEAMIVDPGNCNAEENQQLADFIQEQNLHVKYIVNTHPHIDHILGNGFCKRTFQAALLAHEAGMEVYQHAISYAVAFDLQCDIDDFPIPDNFVEEGDTILFGNQSWEVLYTPGHVNGSICLYNSQEKTLIAGDVIFEESIGRSDLPTGNLRLLLSSIRQKILTLPDDVGIIPGHGNTTSIGNEKKYNPYIHQLNDK